MNIRRDRQKSKSSSHIFRQIRVAHTEFKSELRALSIKNNGKIKSCSVDDLYLKHIHSSLISDLLLFTDNDIVLGFQVIRNSSDLCTVGTTNLSRSDYMY